MRNTIRFLLAASLSFLAAPAALAQVTWADWTTAVVNSFTGSASGTVGGIGVSYSGDVASPTQVSGGIDYWGQQLSADGTTRSSALPSPYTSATVPNAPDNTDVIALAGGNGVMNTILFSQPVTNPIMSIVSLGREFLPAVYTFAFDQEFEILSSGRGYWGGDEDGSLSTTDGTHLLGLEGHGTIQFVGTLSQITWRADPFEFWHGFTVAVIPEPSTYALLLAGLGLMGFVATRRRQARRLAA